VSWITWEEGYEEQDSTPYPVSGISGGACGHAGRFLSTSSFGKYSEHLSAAWNEVGEIEAVLMPAIETWLEEPDSVSKHAPTEEPPAVCTSRSAHLTVAPTTGRPEHIRGAPRP
jgi:hypothetical protein